MKYLFLLILVTSTYTAASQTRAEWIQQKKTAKKYLLEQVAAFEVSLNFIQKGYLIIQEGTSLVSQLSQADLKQHLYHFELLNKLNPSLRFYFQKSKQVGSIPALKQKLDKQQIQIDGHSLFLPDEKRYHKRIVTILKKRLNGCQTEIDEYISGVEAQLTDDDRLRQFLAHLQENEEVMIVCKQFLSDWTLLLNQRERESAMLQRLIELHNE